MVKNVQYCCPECNAVGASPENVKSPLCHRCDYKVTMKRSQNGRILEDDELPFPYISELPPLEKTFVDVEFPCIKIIF